MRAFRYKEGFLYFTQIFHQLVSIEEGSRKLMMISCSQTAVGTIVFST